MLLLTQAVTMAASNLGRITMKLRALLIAAALLATSTLAFAQKDVTETINLFKGIPQVAPFFEKSYGYAVWPRIGRGGLGIGGARGKGQVFQGGKMTGTATLTDITFGAQAGGPYRCAQSRRPACRRAL